MRKVMVTMTTLAAVLCLLALSRLQAQDNQGNGGAPPVSNAAVARLSLISGEVSTQRGAASQDGNAQGDWTAGAINQPLLSGDGVATSGGSRAEVQLDYADLLRLSENSQATLANLTNSALQVQIGQGLADYVVLSRAGASSELDTPNVAIRPRGEGVFRVQVNSDSETVVIVRSGEADISTSDGSAVLHRGQMMTVDGTDQPEYQVVDAPGRDDWDHWNQNRDRQIADAHSWENANHYYTGVGDLDGYGRWVMAPGYGMVWTPAMDPGWTPYSVGRWVYEPYWGWTWVSSEPWGWAPYHYGRWFYYQTGWVWWPGPVRVQPYYRPVWAPAYVAFVGFHTGGVSVGVGFGRIGWVPVGPADPYRPWWGGAPATRVNVTNITNVTNVYNVTNVNNVRVVQPLAPVGAVRYSNLQGIEHNPHLANAVVTVPASNFGRGEVRRETVTSQDMRQAQVLGGRLPVAPTRASYRANDREVSTTALPRAAVERPQHFAGSRPPAPAQRGFSEPAARPRFQSFDHPAPAGERSAGPQRQFNQPETRPQSQPREARPQYKQPAARSEAPMRPSAHGGDPNWHRFEASGNSKSDKNDKGRGKGNRNQPY